MKSKKHMVIGQVSMVDIPKWGSRALPKTTWHSVYCGQFFHTSGVGKPIMWTIPWILEKQSSLLWIWTFPSMFFLLWWTGALQMHGFVLTSCVIFKNHDSSWLLHVLKKKNGIVFNSCRRMSAQIWVSFCSRMRNFNTVFEHTIFMFKICWTVSLLKLANSVTAWMFRQKRNFSVLVSVFDMWEWLRCVAIHCYRLDCLIHIYVLD